MVNYICNGATILFINRVQLFKDLLYSFLLSSISVKLDFDAASTVHVYLNLKRNIQKSTWMYLQKFLAYDTDII